MIYWRPRSLCRCGEQMRENQWQFGYVTYLNDPDLIRLGSWNGDTMGGQIMSASGIEWRPYRR
jgi:hypothetical protein